MQFSSDELAWAAGIVGRYVPPTPQYVWPLLADAVGAEVWVKHENHTPTGAFKVRGGLVYAERLSVAAGRVVATDTASTFIDGIACRVPDADAISVISAGAARVLAISEDDAAEAIRVLFATTHNAAEPAGALALAGLLAERTWAAGKRVAVIQTGGNADASLLLQVLGGQTPTG
jgi:threonine dehydratase